MKKPRRGAGGNGEIMKYEEIMAAIKDINGPWSNEACMGYCLIAMRRAGLRPTVQRREELYFSEPPEPQMQSPREIEE